MGISRRRDIEMRNRRLALGVCTRCAEPRGKAGTTTMCRPCAEKQNAAVLARKRRKRAMAKGLIAPDPTHTTLTCENCFAKFEFRGSGHRVFCDACVPWFGDTRVSTAVDHVSEQSQARDVDPEKLRIRGALDLILDWQRQG